MRVCTKENGKQITLHLSVYRTPKKMAGSSATPRTGKYHVPLLPFAMKHHQHQPHWPLIKSIYLYYRSPPLLKTVKCKGLRHSLFLHARMEISKPSTISQCHLVFNYSLWRLNSKLEKFLKHKGLLTVHVKGRNYTKDKTDFHKVDGLGWPLWFKIHILRLNTVNPIQRIQ